MNTNIKELLDKKKYQNTVTEANKRFEYKPYAVQYSGIKLLSRILACSLPLISVITGLFFLAEIFFQMIPYRIVGFIIGGLILLVVEFVKAFFLEKGFTQSYMKNKAGYFLLALGFGCTMLSAFFSLEGVEKLHSKIDRTIIVTEERHQSELDSINNHYAHKLDSVSKKLTSFKNSVSYRGKINVYNKVVSSTIANKEAEMKSLRAKQEKVLNRLSFVQKEELTKSRENSSYNLILILFLIGSIELSILVSNWFLIHYDWQVSEENSALNESMIEQENPSIIGAMNDSMIGGLDSIIKSRNLQEILKEKLNDWSVNPSRKKLQENASEKQLLEVLNLLLGDSMIKRLNEADKEKEEPIIEEQEEENPKQREIGFGRNIDKKVFTKKKNKSTIPVGLLRDIRNGIRDHRTLTEKHRVNVVMVSKAKKMVDEEERLKAEQEPKSN